MTFPDARTRLVGLAGHPVAHSLSPAIHNAALRHDGVNAVYLAFDVQPGMLAEFARSLRAAGGLGLNVTIPHKSAALRAASDVSETAQRIGAANTLVFTSDGVVAENTDVSAFRRAAAELAGNIAGRRLVVLGAGGAARAAVEGAVLDGAGEVLVANRTASRAEQLAGDLGHAAIRVVPWTQADDAAADADLLVNATSVGLDGEASPIGPEVLRAAAAGGRLSGVLDIVYAAGETPLVRAARAAGLPAADGLGALVHQAADAYALFCSRPAPRQVMTEAAWSAAGRSPQTSRGVRSGPLV